jgi:hypothetical protein
VEPAGPGCGLAELEQKNPQTIKKQITRLLKFKAGRKIPPKNDLGMPFSFPHVFAAVRLPRKENAGKLTSIRDKK